MRELLTATRAFIREDYSPVPYALTLALLSFSLFVNYSSAIDLQWAARGDSDWVWLGHFLALYGGAYFLVAAWCGEGKGYLGDWRFYALAGLAVLTAALPKTGLLRVMSVADHPHWNGSERIFFGASQFFVYQLAITIFGLALAAWVASRWKGADFGLRLDRKGLRTSLLLLLMVSPLIVAASFLPDFQLAYPQYQPWRRAETAFGMGMAQRSAIFTVCYAGGFFAVEALFRGLLVIGLARIMGSRAVLPMAAMYCAFHFGKPMGEAVSSFFGGYLLGILALHSRSITGGLVVHLGIAMLMEVCGHLHHWL